MSDADCSEIMTMKILFVGDNRKFTNWGGRGGSIALYALLSNRFEIGGVIYGSAFVLETAGFGYVNTVLPPKYNWLFTYLLKRRKRRKIFDWYIRLEEVLGAKDFISENPEESLENLLRYKDRYPELSKIYDDARSADLVVLNGEGDLVFSTPPRREALFLLAMIELAVHLKKKVFYVNAVVSDCPKTGRNMKTLEMARRSLKMCSAVSVRDPVSFKYVQNEMPGVKCEMIPDSLFAWYPIYNRSNSILPPNGDLIIPYPETQEYLGRLDFSKPYICVGGTALASAEREKLVSSYIKIVKELSSLGYPIYLTINDEPDSFLLTVAKELDVSVVPAATPIFLAGAVLANAALFVSGRYHPTIFAALGGTPCIFLGSSAHKMRSLQQVLEYEDVKEYPAILLDDDVKDLLFRAETFLSAGNALRKKILDVSARRCQETLTLVDIIQNILK